MKYIVLAFIISISIHFLLFKNYKTNKSEEAIKAESIKQSDITYVKIKKAEPKKVIKKKEVQKPKKKIEKKVIKKKTPKKKILPKKPVKKPTLEKPKAKKIVKKPIKKPKKQVKEKSLQDILLSEQIVNSGNSIQERTLEDFLSKEQKVDPKVLSEIERLYGREFETFTRIQKAFIKNNLNHFQKITQKELNRMGYPRLAARLRISGTNIVEFMFYPDGSIKDLRITKSSGYEIFDEYTMELIEIAYKDYPKPKTATKLKFNVSYSIE